MDNESYGFAYSNYGYAVLGLVLEAVYDTDYTTLISDFAQNELGLTDTKISDKSGDLGNYWDWKDTGAYLSAGAITSNISDMLSYAQMQLENNPYFASSDWDQIIVTKKFSLLKGLEYAQQAKTSLTVA